MLPRTQAETLLEAARESAKPVQPKRLGAVGRRLSRIGRYACVRGTVQFDAPIIAEIPFVGRGLGARRQTQTYLIVLRQSHPGDRSNLSHTRQA